MSAPFDDKRPSRVLEHLFIGNRAHAKNRGLLKELGINRILNVTPPKTMDPSNGVSNFFEKDKSMTYKRVAVFDNRGEDLLQHLASCISFIEQGRFYGKVLVHCSKGVSRSSTVVAAYLMSTRGLSKDAALLYLRSRRPIVNPHEGFTAQLQTFQEKMEEERELAIADGQPRKFPDDLLENKKNDTKKGPSIGPVIGPSRGPSPPPPPNPSDKARSRSPTRGPSNRPKVGPSPPRGASASASTDPAEGSFRGERRAAIGPPRGPPLAPQSSSGETARSFSSSESAKRSYGETAHRSHFGEGVQSSSGEGTQGSSSGGMGVVATVTCSGETAREFGETGKRSGEPGDETALRLSTASAPAAAPAAAVVAAAVTSVDSTTERSGPAVKVDGNGDASNTAAAVVAAAAVAASESALLNRDDLSPQGQEHESKHPKETEDTTIGLSAAIGPPVGPKLTIAGDKPTPVREGVGGAESEPKRRRDDDQGAGTGEVDGERGGRSVKPRGPDRADGRS